MLRSDMLRQLQDLVRVGLNGCLPQIRYPVGRQAREIIQPNHNPIRTALKMAVKSTSCVCVRSLSWTWIVWMVLQPCA